MIEKQGHELPARGRDRVELDRGKAARRMDRTVREQRIDTVRAVALGPFRGDRIGIILADDAVVGVGDGAIRRHGGLRQFRERDETAPVVFARPSLHRPGSVAARADGNASGGDEAHPAFGVGEHAGRAHRSRAWRNASASRAWFMARIASAVRSSSDRPGKARAMARSPPASAFAEPTRSEITGPCRVERTVSVSSSNQRTAMVSSRTSKGALPSGVR